MLTNDFAKEEKNYKFQRNKESFYDLISSGIVPVDSKGKPLTYLRCNKYDYLTEAEAKDVAQYVETKSQGHIKCEIFKCKRLGLDKNEYWDVKVK